MKNRNKILLLIPAYNEEGNIGKVLGQLKKSGITEKIDILVIDDGSKDGTVETAKSYGVEVISQIFNMGYGAALQTGYKYAVEKQYAYLLQMDADGQHDIKNLTLLCERLGIGHPPDKEVWPDIVIGSRFLDGSVTYSVPWLRRVAIAMFRGIIYRITRCRLTDPTSGLQGMNRKAFSYFAGFNNFDIKYPDINMVLQMLLMDYKIEEIPAVMHIRQEGTAMHSGAVHAVKYMVIMSLSTMNAYVRYRKK